MANDFRNINKEIAQGNIIITNDEITKNQNKKAEHVDAITAPTMATQFANASKKYLEDKKRREAKEQNQ